MDPLILGKDATSNADTLVTLTQRERRRGLYILGKTGTGKTTLLVNLILQDIAAGFGLCFMEPHGDAINDILTRLPDTREQDVILLDVLDVSHPFGLNLYECSNPNDIELVARTTEHVMHVFEKLWDVSRSTPRIAQFLRNCALTLIESPGSTMAEIPLLLTDEGYRQRLVRNVTNLQVQQFWRQYNMLRPQEQLDRAESTLNKLDEFLSQTILRNIVGQAHTTIDFRRVMDEGKILLVKLPGRYEDITSLIGSIIIGQLLNAALSRSDTPEPNRRQFNLYIDEFQRFSTPDMATLLVEARKYAICSCISHQFRAQLDQANRGATLNAANMVVFRVSGDDAAELAREFDCTPPPPEIIGQRPILVPKQNVIEHLLRNGHTNSAVNSFVQTYLVPAEVRRSQDKTTLYSKGLFDYYYVNLKPSEIVEALSSLNSVFYTTMSKSSGAVSLPEKTLILWSKIANFFYVFDKYFNYAAAYNDSYPSEGNWGIISLLCGPDYEANLPKVKQSLVDSAFMRAGYKAEQFPVLVEFLRHLRGVIDVLSKDPILADSGTHEAIYDKPRTYADVQNQIANDLVLLKNGLARVKLPTGEYTIRTILPNTPKKVREALLEKQTRIQEQTRVHYCTPREKVEEEIRKRQEPLPLRITPKHTT
jgi:hypothetical protein